MKRQIIGLNEDYRNDVCSSGRGVELQYQVPTHGPIRRRVLLSCVL